jgi:hypothetical protein
MHAENVPSKSIDEKMSLLDAKMVELRFLKQLTIGLRSYRKMIGVKNCD